MVNPLRGELAFVQAGSPYTLVLDVNALCAAEAALGMKAYEITAAMTSRGHLSALRGLFWAGLQRHHALSLIEAGDLLQDLGQLRGIELMLEALQLSFPTPGEKPARPRKAARGTGSSSSAST